MSLFTFILEFAGGTYVAQVRADSADQALKSWATGLSAEALGAAPSTVEELRRCFVDDAPTAIQGVASVWCASATSEDRLALVHLVRTSE